MTKDRPDSHNDATDGVADVVDGARADAPRGGEAREGAAGAASGRSRRRRRGAAPEPESPGAAGANEGPEAAPTTEVPSGTDAAPDAPAGRGAEDAGRDPDRPDADVEGRGEAGDGPDAGEAIAGGDDEPGPVHKLSRKELLARLLEKNDLLMRLQRDNSRKERELKEVKDRFLRSVAEFENYRRRSRKEWELLKHQAKVDVILGVLEVVDDFERALAVVNEDDTSDLVQGIRLIYNNLRSLLERHGVREVPGSGSRFDPVHHMAVGQIETDAVESGHVVEVVQKGYRIGDAVIRPARVIVAK